MRPLSPEQKRSLEEATREYEQHRSLVDDYLAARGFDPASAATHRLGFVRSPVQGHEQYAGRLAIPYIGPKGNVYGLRFRAVDDSEPKYLGLPGVETRLFNLRALSEATDFVVICEGELDAVSCTQAGVPAVGVPGVDSWKAHHRRLFDGFDVLVVGDNDKAGRGFVKKMLNDIHSARPVILGPDVNDVNDLLREGGTDAVRELFQH